MLKGKTAVVTGVTRGIGFAIVKKYLDNGANVALAGSRKESVDKALEKLNIPAGTMLHIESDIKAAEKELNDDSESIITNERYVCIAGIIKSCYSKKNAGALSISDTDIDCIDGRDGAYNSAACASKKTGQVLLRV